jgi:hypothetical protein
MSQSRRGFELVCFPDLGWRIRTVNIRVSAVDGAFTEIHERINGELVGPNHSLPSWAVKRSGARTDKDGFYWDEMEGGLYLLNHIASRSNDWDRPSVLLLVK